MILSTGEHRPPFGRKTIWTDKPVNRDTVASIISEGMTRHLENQAQEEYLYNYERGLQPILNKTKKVRPEINNKIVENNAAKIVDIHVAYDFSNPLTFVRKTAEGSGETEDEAFSLLNQWMQMSGKAKKDVDMAHKLMCGGIAYMGAFTSRDPESACPFELVVPDPRTTFIVYSNDIYKEPVLAVTFFNHVDGSTTYTAYSKDKFYRFGNVMPDEDGIPREFPVNVYESENVIHEIPIVEFQMTDRMGVFEKVIPIMDAINQVNSDRVDAIDQHVQSLLWLNNCKIDSKTYDKLRASGVISTESNDGTQASVAYLSQPLDQAQTQTIIDYYQSQILQITSTPSWQEASGGSTTGAMQLSNGWQSLELSAKTVEMQFDEPERRLLKAVKAIILNSGKDDKGIKDIEMDDIDIKFNRNKTFDLVSKTNSLVSLLNSGIYGLDAISTVGLFTDPQKTWDNSKETIEKMQSKSGSTNTNNVFANANADTDEDGRGGVNNDEKDKTEESLQPSKVAGVAE